MIVIADTNLFISAIVFGSAMNLEILEYWFDNRLELVVSQELIDEIIVKLKHFKQPKETLQFWGEILTTKAIIFQPKTKITVCRDSKDNFLLELAQESNADFLLTRDKDLLDLDGQKWKNTEIVKPEDFLAFFRTKD